MKQIVEDYSRSSPATSSVITLITATFNGARPLAEMAHHVRGLGYHRLEWIVVDGGSCDGTAAVMEANRDIIAVGLSEPDRGIYDAWNKGVARATGEWIIFLGTDDRVEPTWLEAVGSSDTEADVLYGDLAVVHADSGATLQVRRLHPWPEESARLRRWMSLPHTGMAHHRRMFAERRFDTELRIFGDWEFLLRGWPLRGQYFPGQVQARMALGGVSNGPQRIVQAHREMRAVQRCYSLSLPMAERLRWEAKLAIARCPWLYGALQTLYWRGKLRG